MTTIADMKIGALPGEGLLPLVLEPTDPGQRSIHHLTDWIRAHRAWLDARMLVHGAALFRGFDLNAVEDFERATAAIAARLDDYTRGISPRTVVGERVYTSTDLPHFLPIPQHCEMSYSDRYPSRVLFACLVPSPRGGETPLADMRRVRERLEPRVRERFERLGVRIIQNVPYRARHLEPKGWPEMFGTHDRAEVEAACRAQGIEASWHGRTLRMLKVCPGSIRHPVTGEWCWFNSATTFHDSFSSVLREGGRPTLAAAAWLAERVRRVLGHPESWRRHCTYGDGSEIALADMEHIRSVLRQERVVFPWQAGDLLVVDNVLVSHGRMPFHGPRRVLAALVPQRPEQPVVRPPSRRPEASA